MKKIFYLFVISYFYLSAMICHAESYQEVINWYNRQIPVVNECLINHLQQNVNDIKNINIDDNKFVCKTYGDGYDDCNYIIKFTCKTKNEPCYGEAWGFRKYLDNTIAWYIIHVIGEQSHYYYVKQYLEEYEDQVNAYYKYLITTYK